MFVNKEERATERKRGNPLGKDTVNIGANVPKDVYSELVRLAGEASVGVSTYSAWILIEAALSSAVVVKREKLKFLRENAAKELRELVDGRITPETAEANLAVARKLVDELRKKSQA